MIAGSSSTGTMFSTSNPAIQAPRYREELLKLPTIPRRVGSGRDIVRPLRSDRVAAALDRQAAQRANAREETPFALARSNFRGGHRGRGRHRGGDVVLQAARAQAHLHAQVPDGRHRQRGRIVEEKRLHRDRAQRIARARIVRTRLRLVARVYVDARIFEIKFYVLGVLSWDGRALS